MAANTLRVKRLKAQDDLTESQTAASLSLGVLETGTVDPTLPQFGPWMRTPDVPDTFCFMWPDARHYFKRHCATGGLTFRTLYAHEGGTQSSFISNLPWTYFSAHVQYSLNVFAIPDAIDQSEFFKIYVKVRNHIAMIV